nr:MAG TPA: hypothetical protein [Caudoviricetes sp.]
MISHEIFFFFDSSFYLEGEKKEISQYQKLI